MTEFIRNARLEVKIRNADFTGYERTLILEGLRVSFYIQKNLSITPNSGIIKIWNLSQSHRNLIKDYGDQVTVYAGYERGQGLELLYVGDTTAVYHSFDFPDIISTFECADGYKYINQKHVSLSFAPQTTVREVINKIATDMGIVVGEFSIPDSVVYGTGFSSVDLLKEALLKACALANLQVSVQNNKLQIIPINGTIIEQPFQISSDTGMIGVPERYTFVRSSFYEKGPAIGYKVNTFLKPQILPGARVNLNSRYLGFQGIFRVETVKHNGDTYGPFWQTNLELTEVRS